MFILSSDIFSHLLLSSIYLTSTSFPFSLSGHPSSSSYYYFSSFVGGVGVVGGGFQILIPNYAKGLPMLFKDIINK